MKGKKNEIVYAFIDSQNLNLGTSKDVYRQDKLIYKGWQLDFRKFRQYLFDKFRVQKAFLFIGYIHSNEKLYCSLKKWEYILIFKPTIRSYNGKMKGNIDAELVLYSSCIEYQDYDKAVIVSGDGDFLCLYEFLQSSKKLKSIIIPNKYSESSLLKSFHDFKVYLYREKEKLKRE